MGLQQFNQSIEIKRLSNSHIWIWTIVTAWPWMNCKIGLLYGTSDIRKGVGYTDDNGITITLKHIFCVSFKCFLSGVMQHNPTMFVFHATIEAPTTAEVLVASEAGISAGHFQRPVDLYLATMRFVSVPAFAESGSPTKLAWHWIWPHLPPFKNKKGKHITWQNMTNASKRW